MLSLDLIFEKSSNNLGQLHKLFQLLVSFLKIRNTYTIRKL